ncbi:MAG: hypothetical protein K2W96_05740 [Gemmataceae bacterium]|nr:hypothetical protein [Gemmataceae bacterium]
MIALLLFAAAPPCRLLEAVALVSPPGGFSPHHVDFSPDGKRLAACGHASNVAGSGTGDEARVWDIAARRPVFTCRLGMDSIHGVALSPKGELFVLGHQRVEVRDASGNRVRGFDTPRHGQPGPFALLDGGKVLARAWPFIVHDAASGKELSRRESRVIRRPGYGTRRLMATLEHQDVDVWDVRTGALLATLPEHPGECKAVAIRRDEKEIAVAVAGKRPEVRIWSAAGKSLRTVPTPGFECGSLALSDDGSLIAAGNRDGMRVWETRTGGELARHDGHGAPPLQFAPGGGLLAAARHGLRLWRIKGR